MKIWPKFYLKYKNEILEIYLNDKLWKNKNV